MATILFTYEFGAGLGHLNRLLSVAKLLRDHRCVFVLPDVPLGRDSVLKALGAETEVRQGDVWAAPNDPNARRVPTHTFADVIRLFGFHDVGRLERKVRGWVALLDEIRPDLIVADFAPAVRLAAQGRFPMVVVGNGYTVPPEGRLLPPMRPWEEAVPAQSRAHEGELITAVNTVRGGSSGPPVDYVSDLFQGDATFVCTLSEFDPYRSCRSTAPLWPFNVPVISPEEEDERDVVFAYFQAGHPALNNVLAALSLAGRRAEVFVQSADPRMLASRCSRNVGLHTKPANFASVLPRSSLLVHHAGLGTAYSGLIAGVPQVVLPVNLEHAITTAGLGAFGVARAVSVTPPPTPEQLASSFAEVLRSDGYRVAARQAAASLQQRRDPASVERVVEACRGFL